jgi:hypothetical protein
MLRIKSARRDAKLLTHELSADDSQELVFGTDVDRTSLLRSIIDISWLSSENMEDYSRGRVSNTMTGMDQTDHEVHGCENGCAVMDFLNKSEQMKDPK